MIRSSVVSLLSFLLAVAAFAAPPSATVTTIAGIPQTAGYWDGPPQDAMFMHPTWLDVATADARPTCEQGENGEIFVVDRINQLIRRIATDGTVTTMHEELSGFFALPRPLDFGTAFGGGILVEPPGSGCGCDVWARGLFVASSGTNQVLLMSMRGSMASRDQFVVIGSGNAGSTDALASQAELRTPLSIARSWRYGNDNVSGSQVYSQSLYIADSGNHTIRRTGFVFGAEGCAIPNTMTTLAGSAGQPGHADGKGSAARFNTPRGVAGAPDGSVYVTDAGNDTIRRIAPDGTVTTVAGEAGVAGSNDGPALQAHLNTPSGIDVNAKGEVFIVDTFNHTIRELTLDGRLITIAGQPGVSGFADGDGATAKFNAPVGLKIAPDGSIVVADTGNNIIRRVTLGR